MTYPDKGPVLLGLALRLQVLAVKAVAEVDSAKSEKEAKFMLGWTILFALISLSAMVANFAAPVSFCLQLATVTFTILFVCSLLTRAARVQHR